MILKKVRIKNISQLNLLIFSPILGIDKVLRDFKDIFELVDTL